MGWWHCWGFPGFWVHQHCDPKLVATLWFIGIINRAQTMLPHASTLPRWSPPPALGLFSSLVSSSAAAKRGLGRSSAKYKRSGRIYFYWALGRNPSLKYTTEKPASLLKLLRHGCTAMSQKLRITSALGCHLKNGVELLLKSRLIHQSDTRMYDHGFLLCIGWA